MKCLNDIKKTRTTFDTSETRKEFGPVVVDYAKVQSKVSLMYDSWHKDTLAKFGAFLGNEMNSFHTQVSMEYYLVFRRNYCFIRMLIIHIIFIILYIL